MGPSTAPSVTTSQMDNGSVGDIGKSVNLFRGDVTFPVSFLQLTGPNNLDVHVNGIYNGNVFNDAVTWNRDATTGLLGLGWDLPIDSIELLTEDVAPTPGAAVYAIASQGMSSPLIPVGVEHVDGEERRAFSLAKYQPWKIAYFPADERWEVTKEDGVTYTYGGRSNDRNAVQWKVRRGTWVGSSSNRQGEQYATAWNLCSVRHYWGDAIELWYESDDIPIDGKHGPCYTRASRVSHIKDGYDRIIKYTYLDKEASEYQPSHGRRKAGYQDRYEARYLSSLAVVSTGGEELQSVHFGYELASAIEPDGVPSPDFVKRYLTSICQFTSGVPSNPGIRFKYRNLTLQHGHELPNGLGSLDSIVYPSGAIARYDYGTNRLADRYQSVTGLPGAVPRVWFGSNYIVVTWYNDDSAQLQVNVYSWSGCWTNWSSNVIQAKLSDQGSTLEVATSAGFFALSYTNAGSSIPELALFHHDRSRFGQWTAWSPPAAYPAVAQDSGRSQLAAGDDFVAFAPAGSVLLYRYSRNRSGSGWDLATIGHQASSILISARSNYFVVMAYQDKVATATLHHRDSMGAWRSSEFPDTMAVQAAPGSGAPLFGWSCGSGFVVATFVAPGGISRDSIEYGLRIYHWDASYGVECRYQTAGLSVAMALEVSPLLTTVHESLVCNLGNLLRYDGTQWHLQQIPYDDTEQHASMFAAGDDVGLVSDKHGYVAGYAYDASRNTFDAMPLARASSNAGSPPRVTASADWTTIGTDIYFRDAERGWTRLPHGLPSEANQRSILNRAPSFLAYEVGTGGQARAAILVLKNGSAHAPTEATVQGRILSEGNGAPGTILCGQNAFVTYSGPDFDHSQTLNLYHVANGEIGIQRHCPVKHLSVDDGYQIADTAYWYDCDTATYDASGSVAQYARARAFPGMAAVPNDGALSGRERVGGCPFGYTESMFYNGMDPGIEGVFYPGDTYNYYSLLGGNALCTKDFDSQGRLVSMALSRYRRASPEAADDTPIVQQFSDLASSAIRKAFSAERTQDVLDYLDGLVSRMPEPLAAAFEQAGFVLSPRIDIEVEVPNSTWILIDGSHCNLYIVEAMGDRISVHAGFTTGERREYEPEYGLLRSSMTFNRSTNGNPEERIRSVVYAWQQKDGHGQPAYRGMHEHNLLTSIAQATECVNGTITANSITLYDNDWGFEGTCWAARASYRALSAESAHAFDTDQAPDPSLWQRTAMTLSRNRRGQEIEVVDATGVYASTIFDRTDRAVLASCSNASIAGDEVAYFGAERYETNPGWTLQPDGGVPAVREGSAHTGTRSIRLDPDPSATLALDRALRTSGGDARYMFSWWYATDPGFEDEIGDAGVEISLAIGDTRKSLAPVPMKGTGGVWTLGHVMIDLAEESRLEPVPAELSLEIRIANRNARAAILLDELRLIPVASEFSGQVIDASHEATVARLNQNAHAVRTAYAGNGTVCASTRSDDVVSSISSSYFSRSGNSGSFRAEDPNLQVVVMPAGGGTLQDYRRTQDWKRYWQGDSGGWSVEGGALTHLGNDVSSLMSTISFPNGEFGCLLQVDVHTEVAGELSIAYGDDIRIDWIPGQGATEAGAWRFCNDASADVLPCPACHLSARYAALLDRDGMTDVLRGHLASLGMLLSPSNCTIVNVATGVWVIHDPDAGQRYRVEAGDEGDELSVTCLTLRPQPLLLVVTASAVLFYADSRPIFQQPLSALPEGVLTLSASDPVGFRDIVLFAQPRLSHTYQDASGRATQTQALETPLGQRSRRPRHDCLTTASLYDALGRHALQTKTFRYGNALPGYRATAITGIDPVTGVLHGDCADHYPGDGGYPYSRTRYGDWPGAGPVEIGQPGSRYAITSSDPLENHTCKGDLSANPAGSRFHDMGFCAGDYQVATSIDQNGNASHSLQDKAGRCVARSTPNGTGSIDLIYRYDRAGRLTELVPPNALDAGMQGPQQPTTIHYDFLGRRLEVRTPDAGTPTRFAYDSSDRLRFSQDAAGAGGQPETVQYHKYDRLGRRVESGYVTCEWATLAGKADDPAWPDLQVADGGATAEPATPPGIWRQHWSYDGDGSSTLAMGKLYATGANNGTENQADVVETYHYGTNGAVTCSEVHMSALGGRTFATGYRHDAQGNVLEIRYPDGSTRVICGYDSLGKIVSIDDAASGAAIARYTYTAMGLIECETLDPDGDAPVVRRYAYNPCGMTTGIADQMLEQTLRYEGGVVPRYDGRISGQEVVPLWPDSPPPCKHRFEYDDAGQLTSAKSEGSGDLGTTSPISYDRNGNIRQLFRDGSAATYEYAGSSNRVSGDGDAGKFLYNASGSVVSASKAGFVGRQIDRIDYDPGTVQARHLAITGGPASTVDLAYDALGRRAIKHATGDGMDSTTAYLFGSTPHALVELTIDGNGAEIDARTYVYGPRGIIRMVRDGTSYSVLNDQQGSTRAVIDQGTGEVAAHYDYSPFGDIVRTGGNPRLMRYLYTGQEYDHETGLYNYRARLYDSRLGRFYAVDPLAEFATPYCYVGNDPMGAIDPSGMSSEKTVSQSTAYIVHGVELGISVVEVVAGIALCFVPLPFCRILGKIMIGAGINGAVYSMLHFRDTTLSLRHGFIGAEVMGAAFGLIGGVLTEGLGGARRAIRRTAGRAIRTDLAVEAVAQNAVTVMAQDAEATFDIVGSVADEALGGARYLLGANAETRHMVTTVLSGVAAHSALHLVVPEVAYTIEATAVGAYAVSVVYRASAPIVSEVVGSIASTVTSTVTSTAEYFFSASMEIVDESLNYAASWFSPSAWFSPW